MKEYKYKWIIGGSEYIGSKQFEDELILKTHIEAMGGELVEILGVKELEIELTHEEMTGEVPQVAEARQTTAPVFWLKQRKNILSIVSVFAFSSPLIMFYFLAQYWFNMPASRISLVAVLTLLNIPVYFFLGKKFFGSWDEFIETIQWTFKPNFFSFLEGQYWEDKCNSWVMGLFEGACALIVFIQYKIVTTLFF